MRNTLLLNAFSFLLVNLLPQLGGFFLAKVYTDHLSLAEYGIFGVLASVPPMLAIFVTLQFQASIPRFYVDYTAERRKDVMGVILLCALLLNLLITGVVFPFREEMVGWIMKDALDGYGRELAVIVLISSASGMVASFQAVLVVKEQASKILKRVSFISLGVTLTQYLSVVYFHGGVYEILVVMLFGVCLNLLFAVRQVSGDFRLGFSPHIAFQAFKYSFPLIFHQLGGYFFNFASVLVVARFLGVESVAFFVLMLKLSSVMKIAVNSFNSAWQPRYFKCLKKYSTDSKAFFDASVKLSSYVFVVIYYLCSTGISALLLSTFNAKYHGVVVMLPMMMGAFLIRLEYCFKTSIIFYRKDTLFIPLVTLLGGFVNLAVGMLLVRHFGLWSFVLSFFSAYLVMLVFVTLVIRYKYGQESKGFTLVYVAVVGLATLQNFFMADWLILNFSVVFVVVGVFLFVYRRVVIGKVNIFNIGGA